MSDYNIVYKIVCKALAKAIPGCWEPRESSKRYCRLAWVFSCPVTALTTFSFYKPSPVFKVRPGTHFS